MFTLRRQKGDSYFILFRSFLNSWEKSILTNSFSLYNFPIKFEIEIRTENKSNTIFFKHNFTSHLAINSIFYELYGGLNGRQEVKILSLRSQHTQKKLNKFTNNARKLHRK